MSVSRSTGSVVLGYRLGTTSTGEDGQMVTLTTSRLLLRRWREDDLPAMAAINADPEVMRWIGDGTPVDDEATAAATARSEQHWETHGFGLFAVEIRASGELAGFTGLNTPYFLPEVLPAVEIGWRLGRQYWGQGIATEAAQAALDFGFTDRGLDRIVSIHQLGNDASGRVMQKLGMQLDREITDSRGWRVRIYGISRNDYRPAGPAANRAEPGAERPRSGRCGSSLLGGSAAEAGGPYWRDGGVSSR